MYPNFMLLTCLAQPLRASWLSKLLILGLVFLLLPAGSVFAATINIDTTCSLVEAINEANGATTGVGSCEAGDDNAADAIVLTGDVTITNVEMPTITEDLTVTGGTHGTGDYFRIVYAWTLGYTPGERFQSSIFTTEDGAELTLNSLEITNGGGANAQAESLPAIRLGDSATLRNISIVLANFTGIQGTKVGGAYVFENVYFYGQGQKNSCCPAAIHARAGAWTFTNTAFNGIAGGYALIGVGETAQLTFNGCLSVANVTVRVVAVTAGGGVTDNSAGICSSPFISASRSIATTRPAVADCGLPAGGTVNARSDGQRIVYRLTADCTLTGYLFFMPGTNVLIESDDPNTRRAIYSASNTVIFASSGNVTLRNVTLVGASDTASRLSTISSYWPGSLNIRDTTFRITDETDNHIAILIDSSSASLARVRFDPWTATNYTLIAGYGTSKIDVCELLSGNTTLRLTGYPDAENPCLESSQTTETTTTSTQDRGRSNEAMNYMGEATPPPAARRNTCLDIDNIVVSPLTVGTQCSRLDVRGVGNQQIIDRGITDAVDIWGWVLPDTQVCFTGDSGAFSFLDAATAPRSVMVLPPYRDAGMICAKIDGAGIVVLHPGPPAPAATAVPPLTQSVSDCMVSTLSMLNFRESPGGEVKEVLPYDVKLTAFESTGDWFLVDYHGAKGWISAAYVHKHGDCEG